MENLDGWPAAREGRAVNGEPEYDDAAMAGQEQKMSLESRSNVLLHLAILVARAPLLALQGLKTCGGEFGKYDAPEKGEDGRYDLWR